MVKTTQIQIRATEKEKEALSRRAERMFMSMSEYLIHAGLVYTPSSKVQEAVNTLNSTFINLDEQPKDLDKITEPYKELFDSVPKETKRTQYTASKPKERKSREAAKYGLGKPHPKGKSK